MNNMSEIRTTNNQIVLEDLDGVQKVYNVLFIVESTEFKKNYVVYYLENTENDENIELIASSYTGDLEGENNQDLELHEVETDEEWALLNNALNDYTTSFE